MLTFARNPLGHPLTMPVLRDPLTDSGHLRAVGATFHPAKARSHEQPHPDRFRAWVQRHRPPFQTTDRSWFVMLAAVCVGIAMVTTPSVFLPLAAAFAFVAWWRRESARQGLIMVALWALIIGLFLVVLSIVVFIVQNAVA